MKTDAEIRALARGLVQISDHRWWMFWRPKLTEEHAVKIIREVLIGEHEPIRIYGVER